MTKGLIVLIYTWVNYWTYLLPTRQICVRHHKKWCDMTGWCAIPSLGRSPSKKPHVSYRALYCRFSNILQNLPNYKGAWFKQCPLKISENSLGSKHFGILRYCHFSSFFKNSNINKQITSQNRFKHIKGSNSKRISLCIPCAWNIQKVYTQSFVIFNYEMYIFQNQMSLHGDHQSTCRNYESSTITWICSWRLKFTKWNLNACVKVEKGLHKYHIIPTKAIQ